MNKEEKINKWVGEWYDWLLHEVSTNIAKDGMRDYATDLLHHIILDLYNLPESKIDQMIEDEKLRWYVLSGCGLQLRSNTSPFYRVWRREKMQARENYTHNHSEATSSRGILEQIHEEYDSSLEECFYETWDNMHFYQKALIEKKFLQNWSFQQIFEYYGISKRHLIKDINSGILYIREKCNQE